MVGDNETERRIQSALGDETTQSFVELPLSDAVQQISEIGFTGHIAATAKHEDEVTALREAGVDAVFNLYRETGVGFADLACATWGLEPAR